MHKPFKIGMQVDGSASYVLLTQHGIAEAPPSRNRLLIRVLRCFKVIVFCLAGHPPRVGVFRRPVVRAAFFVALTAVQAATRASKIVEFISDLRAGSAPQRLEALRNLAAVFVNFALVAASPFIALREVRVQASRPRSPDRTT